MSASSVSAQEAVDFQAVLAGYAKPDAPGCSVAVSRTGQLVGQAAFGLANLETQTPNTTATVFDVASINKQFIAALVLMLVEDGRLFLDDDIRVHLPEMPDYGAPVTIDHLLTQTSGIRDWLFLSMIAGYQPFETPRTYGNADVLEIARRQERLNAPPGEAFSYTNTGYNLLALIVERVSGASLQQFSQERIFTPLGMRRTKWRPSARENIIGRATPYELEDGVWMQGMPLFGNLFTTTGDLLLWNEALDRNRLGPTITTSLLKQGHLNNGEPIEFSPGVAYARGLTVSHYRGVREVAHGGQSAGYRSFSAVYPDQQLSAVVLCNASSVDPAVLAHALVADLLPLSGDVSERPARAALVRQLGQAGEPWRPDADALAAFSGRYASSEAMASVEISVQGTRLLLQIDGRPTMSQLLSATYPDQFSLSALRGSMRFLRNRVGDITGYEISVPRAERVLFERVASSNSRR